MMEKNWTDEDVHGWKKRILVSVIPSILLVFLKLVEFLATFLILRMDTI